MNSMPVVPSIFCRGTRTVFVQGCVRLLPTTGPNMLRDTFPALLDGQAAPTSDAIWESSRFGVDLCTREAKTAGSIARATYELFAGMIEFGLMRKLTDIVTVTDARMERILCRARWPLRRLGSPRPIGKTIAVAGYLEVSRERLQCVREAGRLDGAEISAAGAQRERFDHDRTVDRAVA
jgi:N-acyl-L-homoserine lactone synthetase